MLGSIVKKSDPVKTRLNKTLTKPKGISKMVWNGQSYLDTLKRLPDLYNGVVFPVEIQFRGGIKGWKQQDTLCSRASQLTPELLLICFSAASTKFLDQISHPISLSLCSEVKVSERFR